jgi:hypothetical protein
MDTSGTVHFSQIERRLAQVAVLLWFASPVASYTATVLGLLPHVTAVTLLGTSIFGLSIAILIFLTIRLGRGGLLRLYPRWLVNAPMRTVWLVMGAAFLWYLLGITVLTDDVTLLQFGWAELLVAMFFAAYPEAERKRAERAHPRARN